jgi:hypothetical protein
MFRSLNAIRGHDLAASDGDIGDIHDFLFDDLSWTVRYVVVDTGRWLTGRKVLVSPDAFGVPDWEGGGIPVELTKQQIEDSPPLDADAPVSRQQEQQVRDHFGWPYYWAPHVAPLPGRIVDRDGPVSDREADRQDIDGDPHLRSLREVTGYHVGAADGDVGHVEDIVADDGTWRIRYLIVDTGNWLPGRKVMVSPAWAERIDWAGRVVRLTMTRDAVKDSPE